MLIEAQGQNLRLVLEKMKADNFSRSTILKVGIQILDLLEILHKNRFIHGDLKIENFVLS
jgi:serine/threonine protein kinase